MTVQQIINKISRGRTDFIFHLFEHSGWREILQEGEVKPIQWLVYFNDVTAMRAILDRGGDLSSIDLNTELGHASFFGHCYDVDAKHEITSKDVRTDSNASVFVHRMQKRWAEKHVHDFKMCGGKWVHKRYLVSQRCPN